MKNFKSHFKFTNQEQSGIFYLLLLIIIIKGASYYIENSDTKLNDHFTIDLATQLKIDSLKDGNYHSGTMLMYPFNPNYLSDFKGYTLGMSVKEINRLFDFRSQNKYVNSPEEFQEVTQVSDSLLGIISPYFKFPDFRSYENKQYITEDKLQSPKKKLSSALEIKDLNAASLEELKSIYGIGDKLSARIVKFRDRLGGFLVEEQLYDVYGLEPDVVERALEQFKILEPPTVEKININSASGQEISALVYINFDVAKRIVEYRNIKGAIESFDELSEIAEFPIDKINRIKLYLTL